MAVTHKIYLGAMVSAFNKEVDLEGDEIRAMLCTSAYEPDQVNHRYKSDVTGEVSGTGYTAGGVQLANVSLSTVGTTLRLNADDVQWPSSSITGRYLVYYDAEPGSDATRPLLGFVDFGEDVSTTSGTFQAVWHNNGLFGITVA